MIDLNELEIGDWVAVKHESQKPEYASRHKVIDKRDGMVLVEGFPIFPPSEPEHNAWRKPDNLEPINLTVPIWMNLETRTFQHPGYSEVWVGAMKFRENQDGFFICFGGDNGLSQGRPILFLHDLQHLYRAVTGDELIFRDLNRTVDKIPGR